MTRKDIIVLAKIVGTRRIENALFNGKADKVQYAAIREAIDHVVTNAVKAEAARVRKAMKERT